MSRRRVVWSTTVVALMMWIPGLWAQPADVSQSHDVNVDIQQVFSLTISAVYDYQDPNHSQADNGNGAVDFFTRVPSSTPYELSSYTGEYAVDLVVESNYTGTWYLKVKGSGDFTNGSSTFPLSRLSWKQDGSVTYTPMTTTNATVTNGSATAPTDIYMDYALQIDWADPPGSDYTTTITYTLTATP